MNNLNRILVPVDFSEAAAAAANYAAALYSSGKCELHLLHVLTPRPLEYSLLEPLDWRRRELSEHRVEQALKELENFRTRVPAGLDLRLRVSEGEAAEEIVRYAEDQTMDAVVMPTRGRNRVERLLLIGSVTMKVLHALEKPVVTGVQFENHLPASIRRVLCAVDLGPASERVLCAALQASKRFGARLSVVHALPVFGHAAAEIYDMEWRDTAQGRAKQKLGELTARLGVEADLHVELDQPPRAISGMALKLAADLVVLGRGESDDLIGRLRADAYDIIRLCHCPVVSV
jgi:nucleotide-binding universal stress UspA family protein